MTTIEDKISLFSKIIYDKVNKEKQERLEAFNIEAEKRVNMEKEKIDELRQNLKKEVAKKSNIKANRIVAKERLNKQRELLSLKDKLIYEALEDVRKKLIEFVSLTDYKPHFLTMIQNALKGINKGNYYLIILKRDHEKFQTEITNIINEYVDGKIEIKISEEDFIGGHILKDVEGKFKIDNSIYSKLQESKEIIGIRVMEMLA